MGSCGTSSSTALDAPYGHWDADKLRVRLRRLEVQHLDMDAVCLPPFDVTRLLRDTASTAPFSQHATEIPHDTSPPAAAHVVEKAPESPISTPDTTGSARYSDGRTLTIQITGDDDQLSAVYFAIEAWQGAGLEVIVT